jgi:hypothetical protein
MHRVGALLLPVAPPGFGPTRPGESNTAALDPALSVLGAFFKAVLEHYCEPAWSAISPGEPLIRTLITGHDPEDWDFQDGDAPLLALWRDGEAVPTRLQDGNSQQASAVNVLWVAPPADEQKLAARSPFFRAFSAALLLAYQNERDPCWIKPGNEANPVDRTYGSYVWGLAGIDQWGYGGLRRVPVVIGTGDQPQQHIGYLSTWTILESTETDPAQWGSTIDGVRVGVGSTSVHFNLTDRDPDADDALVRQSALYPTDDT